MTKQDIIKLIQEAKPSDETLQKMVIGWVELAYSAGFQEGMIRGSQVMSQTFEMLFPKK